VDAHHVWLAVGATLVIALGALALNRADAQRPAPPGLRDRAAVAVLARIGSDEVRSSGVVIDARRGLVLVSALGTWGARSVKLGTPVATIFGRLVARNPCDGYALVRTEPWLPGLSELPSAPAPVRESQQAQALVRPWSTSGAPGRVRAYPARLTADPANANVLHIAADLPPSSLGAPVTDDHGRLVGVRGLERAPGQTPPLVPWPAIRAQLSRLRPGNSTVYVGWRDRYGCAGRLARQVAAAHPGFRPGDAILNRPIRPSRIGRGPRD
jgi:hypothetical protein